MARVFIDKLNILRQRCNKIYVNICHSSIWFKTKVKDQCFSRAANQKALCKCSLILYSLD